MEQRRFYLITPFAYTGAAHAFTYHHETELARGQIVTITMGRRQLNGIVTSEVPLPTFKTKPVSAVLDLPPMPTDLMNLADWLTDYYASSPASVWMTMLPTGLAKTRRAAKPTAVVEPAGLPNFPLTDEQTAALALIRSSKSKSHLLQGVTGSGKTRIYLELASDALASGKSCLILVPEITLTPQIVASFESVFGNVVLASHSKLTEAQRHHIWNQAQESALAGQPRIVIGPRSCLFMPMSKLGLIVVDECHETSYKQEQHPKYNAVTAAAYRARETDATLVLGSATPGLTELYLAQVGRLEHIYLKRRANQIPPPQATILDMRNKDLFKSSKFITQPLIDALTDTMAAGRQSLLYLNRRGSASSQVCGNCGHVTTCPNCLLPLTFHADLMRLICHHCNFRRASPAVCPECGSMDIHLLGGGTKRIEAEIERLFPDSRVARLDRDSATLSHVKNVFAGLKRGEIDIIIGTQMIAKGLDLPAVDTVGIVNADTMLHLPDYTAAERTYQLISQVSGRTGRGDRAGQVFIQTYTPDHPAILAASVSNYDGFASSELSERQLLNYPPFVYLLKLTIAAPSQSAAQTEAVKFAAHLHGLPGLNVVGPAPAFIETQSGKYHWILTVKSKNRAPLVAVASNLPSPLWTADLDPVNLL